MTTTAIEWADRVWSPVTGCQTHPDRLDAPLRWRKPSRVFVKSDLFHEDVPDDFIDDVFNTMACVTPECSHRSVRQHVPECWTGPPHTFLILTKRPERMRDYLQELPDRIAQTWPGNAPLADAEWPLPNVWLGVSVEDPATLHRLDVLRDVPNAVPWVSLEPLLEAVDIGPYLDFLRWVVVGGESGKGARPCDVAWIRDIMRQCRNASVPVFVKQLGARPYYMPSGSGRLYSKAEAAEAAEELGDILDGTYFYKLRHPKGGDPSEWPEDLRVRQFPETTT